MMLRYLARHIFAFVVLSALLALAAGSGASAQRASRSSGRRSGSGASRRRRADPEARLDPVVVQDRIIANDARFGSPNGSNNLTINPSDTYPVIVTENAFMPPAHILMPTGPASLAENRSSRRIIKVAVMTSPTNKVGFNLSVQPDQSVSFAGMLRKSVRMLNTLRSADDQLPADLELWSADVQMENQRSTIGTPIPEGLGLRGVHFSSVRFVRYSDATIAEVYHFGPAEGSRQGSCRLPMQTGLELFYYATFCYETLVGLNVELGDFSPSVASWYVISASPGGQPTRTQMREPSDAIAALQRQPGAAHIMIHMFDPEN